ncbi:MAG: RidA family protein [Betaproteobacteria bacterium]|nr:RidA family protein [Betaproteobacteria bacterium]
MRQAISTTNAPAALGTYSQAIRSGNVVYLSGQVGIEPATGELAEGFEAQMHQVFRNLRAVAGEAGARLDDAVRITVFIVDFAHFPKLNEIMSQYFSEPYPSRSTVQVAALPKGALVEVDAILVKP